jgi:hypothetical protein
MLSVRNFRNLIWIITVLSVLAALIVWWPATKNLTTYALFPLFGLVAFSLMWTHYIGGALQRYISLPGEPLKTHFQITSYIVLFCILVHPFLLEFQLFVDGLGLPPQSLLAVYPDVLERLAILAGVVALTCFLAFEFHRLYKEKSWWKYVEWANIGAMLLILWHGFTLGGELRSPWFQAIWLTYAITFVGAVTYTGYHKRRTRHAGNRNI